MIELPIVRLVQSIAKRLPKWSLYDPRYAVRYSATGDHLNAGYGNRWDQYFDIEILSGRFVINGIGIAAEHRGKGHGAALYELLEQVARDMDCERIIMSASGTTPSGETRKAWVIRKFGYVEDGEISVSKVL